MSRVLALRAPLVSAAIALLLSACVSGPGSVMPGGPGGPHGKPVSAFEAAQLQRAQAYEKDGQWAEAAWAWEVLTVLRPDHAAYRDGLSGARQQIESSISDRLQKAQQAHKRGDLDGATTQYLNILALQPEHAMAADALRGIEKERNRKSYLGTPSRITLRRGSAPAAPKAAATAKAPAAVISSSGSPGGAAAAAAPTAAAAAAPDRNELEHIAMLSAQGEMEEAIRLLEKRWPQDRNDPSARRLLADLYVRKAEKTYSGDRSGAINWLQKCLRVDPKHARATALLRQWIDESAARSGGGATKATKR